MDDSAFPYELSSVERSAVLAKLKRLKAFGSLQQYTRVFELSLEGRPPLFVKLGSSNVLAEATAQLLFHTLSKTDGSTPRVPRVFDVFAIDGYYFIVMEKVDAKPLDSCGVSEAQAVQIAASAVRWLHEQLPAIPDTLFGSFMRRSSAQMPLYRMPSVMHPFFKDHEGPSAALVDASTLATYISKKSQRCRPSTRRLSVDDVFGLFGDHRRVCHSDIKHGNFLFDTDSEVVWIVDFEHVSILPEVFQTYAFFSVGRSFAAEVGRALHWQPSAGAERLRPVAGIITMSSGE